MTQGNAKALLVPTVRNPAIAAHDTCGESPQASDHRGDLLSIDASTTTLVRKQVRLSSSQYSTKSGRTPWRFASSDPWPYDPREERGSPRDPCAFLHLWEWNGNWRPCSSSTWSIRPGSFPRPTPRSSAGGSTASSSRPPSASSTTVGWVEKFAGDSVMAAFGVPQAHEDDAERAIRAALAILDATADLGLEARVGVEAGEVVVGDGDSTFATGEAIDLAARLQQSASPNQILIGPQRLPADARPDRGGGRRAYPGAVGRDEPIWAWRAIAAYDRGTRISSLPGAARRARRGAESMLENTYTRVVRDRRAHLVTIFGDPRRREEPSRARVPRHARRCNGACRDGVCRTAKGSRTGRSPRW